MIGEIELTCIGGPGGSGLVSFRKERYVPRGGPDGGDGGRGGDVVVEADSRVLLLDAVRSSPVVRAGAGSPGGSQRRRGRAGEDAVVRVPVGTVVWGAGDALDPLVDLAVSGARVVVAAGGDGGKGNARFATSTRRVPRIAEKGLPGKRATIRLDLRLPADAAVVGLPNAGKSALVGSISRASPKVGAYAFTTVDPLLAAVERGHEAAVIVDLPALVSGAHGGAGLGVSFLRHAWRAGLLVYVLDAAEGVPLQDMLVLREELAAFGWGLCEKDWLVALNKIDLPGAADRAARIAHELADEGIEAYCVSAATGAGTDELVGAMFQRLRGKRQSTPGISGEPTDGGARPAGARRMEIVRKRGGFEVRGPEAARAVGKLGVESAEARAEVARRLSRAGILSALRRAGVKPGDRVRIGDAELEWPL